MRSLTIFCQNEKKDYSKTPIQHQVGPNKSKEEASSWEILDCTFPHLFLKVKD